jgi:hypothetical protein
MDWSSAMKLKEWIKNGNDCCKCKYCWEERTSYEYNEWDCGCYIKGEDFDEKPCYLINPFKWIIGTLKKRKANYYMKHEWDGYIEFMEEQEEREDKLHELFMNEVIGANVICWKDKDGILHECNTESFVRYDIWKVRSKYEEFAHPVEHKKLSTEWKELLQKTCKYFYKRTVGRIIPYLQG